MIELNSLKGLRLLIRVTTKYFCAGLVTNSEGIVIVAAPIMKWAIGKHYIRVLGYYQRKKTLLEFDEIPEVEGL